MKMLSFHQKIGAFVNVLFFVAGVVIWIALRQLSRRRFHKIGFFCDDTSIGYPYGPDTVSFGEICYGGMAIDLTIALTYLSGWSWANANVLWLKLVTGGLRPDFLAVCQLKADSYNCSQGYVTDYECAQVDYAQLSDASQSFPSGHTMNAWFHTVFLVLYIEGRARSHQLAIPKMTIQFLVLTTAVYVSASRLTDFKHHPSDVVWGGLFGLICAYITARFTLRSTKALFGEESNPIYHQLTMTEITQ